MEKEQKRKLLENGKVKQRRIEQVHVMSAKLPKESERAVHTLTAEALKKAKPESLQLHEPLLITSPESLFEAWSKIDDLKSMASSLASQKKQQALPKGSVLVTQFMELHERRRWSCITLLENPQK